LKLLRIAPEVESDLESIWQYVASESGSAEIASRLIDSITGHFLLLAKNPYLGRARDEDLRPGLRSLPAGEYVIFYRVREHDVLILHVLHGRRDIQRFFQPET
jgi:plasmid stabilization system protein ParE